MPELDEDTAAASIESRWWRRLGRSVVSADSYGLVLMLVMVTYAVSVTVSVAGAEAWVISIVLTIHLATFWLILRTSRARPGVRLVAYIVLGLAALVVAASFFVQVPYEVGGLAVITCLLYLIAAFAIVRRLMLRPKIDIETLLGAIAAYLLIGMFFAFAYKAGGEFGSVPFFGPDGRGLLPQDLFFSFVTLTTVGYGNLVPATNLGQTLAVIEAVVGQLFLVVAVGKIISSMEPRQRRN